MFFLLSKIIGNHFLHEMMSNGHNKVRIELKDWNDDTSYAVYEDFHIDSEADNFTLHFGAYSGDAGITQSSYH